LTAITLPPGELTAKEKERGLDLTHPAVRNRIVAEGLERAKRTKPPAFMWR